MGLDISGGHGKMIAVVACVHGNEKGTLPAVAVLKGSFPSVSFFTANKKAIEADKRFIDSDLNRVFPGKLDGDHEERLASDLQDLRLKQVRLRLKRRKASTQ